MSKGKEPVLQLRSLTTYYPIRSGVLSKKTGYVKAVDGVSFSILPNETLGLVGESGCGKSTIGRSILHLEEITSGRVLFDGKDISKYSKAQMRKVYSQMQIIFQDPYSSLNPRKNIGSILREILFVHKIVPPEEMENEINRILNLIGMKPEVKNRFPHEFSGGQRQRISIAKALAVRPKFIICDEAVSALDVSIQAQILSLLKELQNKLGLTYLFIAHGLGAVKYISDHVAVMYLGRIVELASTDELFANPQHPYTKALLNAYPVPNPHKKNQNRIVLQGNVPSPANPPRGCHFHTRCPFAEALCSQESPELTGDSRHLIACHFQSSALADRDRGGAI